TSRGGMITYGLILSAYLFQVYKYKFIATLSIIIVVSIIFLGVAESVLPPHAVRFVKSFNPKSKTNAISQRSSFSDYSIEAFKEKPVFGHGVGALSSSTIDRNLIVDRVEVPAVTDAYWYILLAEMGLFGFLLYLLFLFEVFYSVNLLNVGLLLGFTVQLLGTDIPDTRFYYFAILVL